jgi:pimeloyl-ACP methyl ester carboxylesterase
MQKLETKYVDLEDISLAYTEYGSGPNLIMLHGNSGSKSVFKQYQTIYFSMFHSYAIDSRGHGESISIDNSYSIHHYSDDIIQFCEKLEIKDTYVIGYSDGGNIGLFLAKYKPLLFSKLVLISPNYLVSGTTDNSLKLIQSIHKLFISMKSIGINTSRWIMRFNLMLTDIGISDDELKSISTKIQILYAQDDMIKEEHILDMNRLIPGSTILKINSCSHLSIIGKEDTIKSIKEYLIE